MINGKTKSGYKFEIDERKLDEWDVFEAIADMTSGDSKRLINGTVNFVNIVFGDKKQDLIQFIRNRNNGYCPQESMQALINEIIETANELKNSQSSQG